MTMNVVLAHNSYNTKIVCKKCTCTFTACTCKCTCMLLKMYYCHGDLLTKGDDIGTSALGIEYIKQSVKLCLRDTCDLSASTAKIQKVKTSQLGITLQNLVSD